MAEVSGCTGIHSQDDCTLKGIQELLQPQKIMDKYQKHAPFTWDVLYTFAASPNKWRKEKAKKNTADDEDDGEDWEDDPNLPDDEPEKTWDVPQIPEGFSRNPVLVSGEPLVYLFLYEIVQPMYFRSSSDSSSKSVGQVPVS